MNRTIYKYPITHAGRANIKMPEGARILDIQVQHGKPVLWAMVDTSASEVYRRLAVYGTGRDVDYPEANYLGTFQDLAGLVFHVFDHGECSIESVEGAD